MCPPPKPTYHSDGTGRDTYIRRDPVEQHGKHLYKEEPRLITRFGASGSALTRDRHSGHAGFHPGERDNSVGGPNGVAERAARFLRAPSDTYPVEISKFSTMKEIMLDLHVQGAVPKHSDHRSQISGYSGFVPRCPIAADPEASQWTALVIDREAILRDVFAAMDLNSDGVVSKEEVKRLCQVALVDPDDPKILAAFQGADFSGTTGGGDDALSVNEIIVWNLEKTAALSDDEFTAFFSRAYEMLMKVREEEVAAAGGA